MKLSEQLKQDNACGDFGKALEGYAERAEALENIEGEYSSIISDCLLDKEALKIQVKALEAQIEVMKNCYNCFAGFDNNICEGCKEYSKWQLRE